MPATLCFRFVFFVLCGRQLLRVDIVGYISSYIASVRLRTAPCRSHPGGKAKCQCCICPLLFAHVAGHLFEYPFAGLVQVRKYLGYGRRDVFIFATEARTWGNQSKLPAYWFFYCFPFSRLVVPFLLFGRPVFE